MWSILKALMDDVEGPLMAKRYWWTWFTWLLCLSSPQMFDIYMIVINVLLHSLLEATFGVILEILITWITTSLVWLPQVQI